MAARFWVSGGTGNWSSTTNWSATSGGASGASVPSTADTATFDSSSGSGTATVDSNVTIQTLSMALFTGTLAFGSNTISLNSSGNIFVGGTGYSVTGTPLLISTFTGTTARTPSFNTPTEANSISFTVSAGGGNVTITGSVRNLTFSGTFAGTYRDAALTLYGNLTFKTGMAITASGSARTFSASSGTQSITSAGLNLNFPFTFAGSSSTTYRLQDALTVGTTTVRTITFNIGTLDLNNFTLTHFGSFSSNNSNTRTIAFGTGSYVNLATGSVNVLDVDSTNFTYTGSGNLTFNNGSGTNTSGIFFANGNETNALNINVVSGTGRINLGGFFKNVNLSGFTGRCLTQPRTIYGNFTSSGSTYDASNFDTTFAATSGTQTINTGSDVLNFSIVFAGSSSTTYRLLSNLFVGSTIARVVTLTSGTLDLNNFTLTNYGYFYSNNNNTRAIAFGSTGGYVNTYTEGSATYFWMDDITNFTYTGTSKIQFSPTSGFVDILYGTTAGGSEAKAINLAIGGQNATIAFYNSYILDLTLLTAGGVHTYQNLLPTIYGSYLNQNNYSSSSPFVTITLASTNTSRINFIQSTYALIPDANVSGGVGTIYKLLNTNNIYSGAWNISSSFDTNGYNLNCRSFNFNNSNTKTITISSGNYIQMSQGGFGQFTGSMVGTTLNVTGAEVRFDNINGSFNVPNSTFPTLRVIPNNTSITVSIGSSGNTQTITDIIENSKNPYYGVISPIANSTLNVVNMVYNNLSAGAFVVGPLQTNSSGSQATLNKTSGSLIVSNRSIRDINATGGAVFRAPTNAPYNNIDNGNNTGWNFSPYSSSSASNFFMFF